MLGLEVTTSTLLVLIGAILTAGIPAAAVVWRTRKSSPDSMAVVLSSSATYLIELHSRLESLEARVAWLEGENRAYFRLHGPLPAEVKDDE
tara:strand:+ start:441 stop:713 length:273 start_codon:yes stop_codon:yes gene_type:complete